MAEQDDRLSAEEEAAALAAGFDAARKGVDASATNQEPEAVEQTEEQPEEQPEERAESSEDQGEPETPEEEKPIPGLGMTASEIKSQLQAAAQIREQTEQALAKAHGKIGELNRTVQQLAQTRQQAGPGKLNEKAYKKLKEEYGDDLVEGIVNLFGPGEPAPEASQPTGEPQQRQPTVEELQAMLSISACRPRRQSSRTVSTRGCSPLHIPTGAMSRRARISRSGAARCPPSGRESSLIAETPPGWLPN